MKNTINFKDIKITETNHVEANSAIKSQIEKVNRRIDVGREMNQGLTNVYNVLVYATQNEVNPLSLFGALNYARRDFEKAMNEVKG